MIAYLIGMPGCGKSTIGYRTAQKTGLPFVDVDRIITDAQKMSINEIFEKFGESHFRMLETHALREVSDSENAIVATGGGIVLHNGNIDIMKKTGRIIYINTPVETIIKQASFSDRPLLRDDPDAIYAIYEARHKIYTSCADVILSFGKGIVDTIITEINSF